MTRLTDEQLRQQRNQMTLEQQQRIRLAQHAFQQQQGQRSPQQQNGQSQALLSPSQKQQLQQERFNKLSPEQQRQLQRQLQLRQQQCVQQRPNPMQFPVQSFKNTQLPGSSSMEPPASPSYSRSSSQHQTSPYSIPVSATSASNILPDKSILMTRHGQERGQNAARSSSVNRTSAARLYTPSQPSLPSPTPTLTAAASPQLETTARMPTDASPTPHRRSPTLSVKSHMPTLALPTAQTQVASSGRHQQANAYGGSTQSQQPHISFSNIPHYQQVILRQVHLYEQTMQQSSPTQKDSPSIAGQKRQARDAPEGNGSAHKRRNLMSKSATINHATPVRQNAFPPHQPETHHRLSNISNGAPNRVTPAMRDVDSERRKQQARSEAQLEAERRRIREHQARAAEEARVVAQYQAAHAAALQCEKDHKRREELRKDPSTNYRHILEAYKMMPLKKGELPNRYLTGLLANREMPADLDSDLALAITFAKDHWDYYGQWPKDIARFAGYERERRDRRLGDSKPN